MKNREDKERYVRKDTDEVVKVYNLRLDTHHSVLLRKNDAYLVAATEGCYEMGWRYDNHG